MKGNLTYVDWTVTPGPAFISEKHLAIFENDIVSNEYGDNCAFFARKFKNESSGILQYIDNNLRV
ncbi:hypothetical protein NU08_3046 [Flavobacterium anhuiense]|uniref:Uncharacterized protein n=1 Tax=Flavobacterium anhuiense TaxID=459526 RepID=A0A444VVU4_9FLAO|nr:hypothetical protein [Flavobacterium anhuiense]RYJ37832.1 hypothetical protein NU08_3046 [Flavobacterium anhuiense]